MESLHSLANTECFAILQDKLNTWRQEYGGNCVESNIGRCCEILELNAKIQAQMFKLLGLCAIQGDLRGSESRIKKRMLPFLTEEYLSQGLTSNIVMDILTDVSRKTKKITSKSNCENGHCHRQRSYSNDRHNPKNISDKLDELQDMVLDMSCDRNKHANNGSRKKKDSLTRSESFSSFPYQTNNDTNEPADSPDDTIAEIRNDTYLQGVVGEYNNLFSESRISSMEILRQHVDDHENNQRIIFALIMTAAKNVAEVQRSLRKPYGLNYLNSQKMEFRKSASRSILKSLRARIIYELINNRGNYFQFHIPHKFLFVELDAFVDRAIELFWRFGGVNNGLQLSEAADGELFDEHKYRRSYDSDFNAPLVSHHIWPCLIQNRIVLVKGEACTRASSKMALNRSICATNNPRTVKHSSK